MKLETPTAKFWRLDSPNYDDYKSAFINGGLEHPYRLPDINCDVCDGGNCGEDIVLPYECPPSWQTKRFKDPEPVTTTEFKRLAEELQSTARPPQRLPDSLIRPCCELQPCFLDVPSKPTADFLWCYLRSVVVSERIKKLIEELDIADVAFAPVTMRKVGTRSAKLPPPMPSTGEPEDIINEVAVGMMPESSPRYYEMLILAQSKPPPSRIPTSVCSACGAKKVNWTSREKLMMLPSMWTGADVFFMATTAYVLVTDKLRQHLQRLRPTNVEIKEFVGA